MRTDLGAEAGFPEGKPTCVTVGARTIAVFKVSGKTYALDNTRTHLGGPLCKGLSEIFARTNAKWGTEMTYCIYPSKERTRDMILNVRGSPMAPAEID